MTIPPSLSSASSPPTAFATRQGVPPDRKTFLNRITPKNPAGPSLRYDSLYDEVRTLRLEDDPRLSMGIWQTDLKRADWAKIENLCIEALLKKTKDLQVAAWLGEAWTALDGTEGYTRGILLLEGLARAFWKNIHPQPLQDQDMESRYMIFEWVGSTFSTRLLDVALTYSQSGQQSLGLGFLKSAQHADVARKRDDQGARTTLKEDPSKTTGNLEDFHKALEQTPTPFLSSQHKNIDLAIEATQSLQNTLDGLVGKEAPSFSSLLKTLTEMNHILATALQKRTPPPPALPSEIKDVLPVSTNDMPAVQETLLAPVSALTENPTVFMENHIFHSRQEAYRHLELIAGFLEKNDPHSPAHQLIRQLIRWENQNILDIFGEIAQSPQDLGILMRLLGSPPRKKEP